MLLIDKKKKNKYKFFNLVAPKNLYWPELAVTLDEIMIIIF